MKNKDSKNEKGKAEQTALPRMDSFFDLRRDSKTASVLVQEGARDTEALDSVTTPARDEIGYQIIALAIETEGRKGRSLEFAISEVADVFNFLFGRIGLPLELRAYVMALIGASEGQTDWFECPDKDLAIRLLGDEADGKTTSALKKRVQRYRAKMIAWQKQKQMVLVETDVGFVKYKRDERDEVITGADGMPQKEYHSTRYRLPILREAAEVLRKVHGVKGDQSNYEITTKFLIARLQGIPIEHDSAGRLDEDKMLRRYRAQGKALIYKAVGIVRERGGYTRHFLNEVVKELEGAIRPDDPTWPDD